MGGQAALERLPVCASLRRGRQVESCRVQVFCSQCGRLLARPGGGHGPIVKTLIGLGANRSVDMSGTCGILNRGMKNALEEKAKGEGPRLGRRAAPALPLGRVPGEGWQAGRAGRLPHDEERVKAKSTTGSRKRGRSRRPVGPGKSG